MILLVNSGPLGAPPRSAVRVDWTDNSDSPNAESSFLIQWSKASDFDPIVDSATVAPNIETYTIKRLQVNTLYYIRVRAQNATGNSSWLSGSITTG